MTRSIYLRWVLVIQRWKEWHGL